MHLLPSAAEGQTVGRVLGNPVPQAESLEAWLQPKPPGTPPLLLIGLGTKSKSGFKGTRLPQAGGAPPGLGHMETIPLLLPDGQGPKRPSKFLQMVQLGQAQCSYISPQQASQPSTASGLDSKG